MNREDEVISLSSIVLVSDSTCDLNPELLQKHQIQIVPLHVNFGDQSFRDGFDLTVDQMYQRVLEEKTLPKTSAASPGEFLAVFEPLIQAKKEIIYIGIGSGFSATLQSARLAKQMLETDHIHLIDSKNLSSGSGLLLLKAAKWIKEGKSAKQVVALVEALIPHVRTQFVISTMDYLHKGGRCNSVTALVGTILKIKPIIKVVGGAMEVGKKPRGLIQHAVNVMFEDALLEKDQIDPDFIMITHSKADDSAAALKGRITQELGVQTVYETQAGCVISSHCGPGCIGILYLTKSAKVSA